MYTLILAFECTLDHWFPQRAGCSCKIDFVVTYKSHKSRGSECFEKLMLANIVLFHDRPRKGMKLDEKNKKTTTKKFYLTFSGKMNLSDKSVLNSITSC